MQSKPGAPICLFIDWRQYPSITDALQWAGRIWRGTAVWDKGNSRSQKGRFRQQAGMVDPKRNIGDMALRSRIELLQQQNRELEREVETLRKDKERLEKALNRRDMELMKSF